MDLERLCWDLVREGVAPTAAMGWAKRRKDGEWEVSVGGATKAFFDLASLTKPMTAFAVARSGLDRSAPISAYLQEAKGTRSENATLELLLSHRAGLEAHVALYRPLVEGKPFDRSAALIEALNAVRSECVGPIPAEGFAPVYSDLGYILVGEALGRAFPSEGFEREVARELEKVALDFQVGRWVTDRDLGSAKMLREGVLDFAHLVVPTEVVAWRGGEIRGHVHDENAWALNGDALSGHAGMFGTIEAVLRFGTIAHDAIANEPSMEWLARPRPGGTLRAGFDGKSDEGSSAGTRCGARTYGHLGFTGTSLWIDPDAQAVIALLTNRVHPTRENVAIRAARPRIHDALFALAAGDPNG